MSLLYHNKDIVMKLKRFVLDIFFPPICINCKKITNTPKERESLCTKCFSTIRINKVLTFSEKRIRIAAIGSYEDAVLKETIHSLKYSNIKSLKHSLKDLISKYIQESDFIKNINNENWAIIPIPLHSKKERERGFNQAMIIAQELSLLTNIPIIKNALRRKSNINKAFKVLEEKKNTIKNIIVVDDVYTSGSTANEAIKSLKEAKFNKFVIFVLAKTA